MFYWLSLNPSHLFEPFLVRSRRRRQSSLLWMLSTAVEQNMPLSDTVRAVAADSPAPRWSRRTELFADYLDDGMPIADALDQVPNLFPRDVQLAVQAGAESGTLGKTLRHQAITITQREQRRNSWLGFFLYLFILLLVMVNIVGFIMYFIIPKFKKIFEDFATELPAMTKITISLSDAVVNYFYLPIVLLIVCLLTWLVLRRTWLWVPLIDSYRSTRSRAPTMLRVLSDTVSAGRPLAGVLGTLGRPSGSSRFSNRVLAIRQAAERGNDVWLAFVDEGFLTLREARILHAAERVGNLPWALEEIATRIEERRGNRWEILLELVRPFVLLAIGVFVGFLIISLFMPLVKLLNDLS